MTVPAWRKKIGINPNPCTPSDDRENWAAVIRMLNDLASVTDILDTDGGGDAGDTGTPGPPDVTYNGDLSTRATFMAPGMNPGVIYRNDSSDVIQPGYLMRVTQEIQGNADNTLQFYTIDQPNGTFQRQYLVNSWGFTAAGEFGVGHWCYESARLAYDPNDANAPPVFGHGWGAKSGSWYASSHRPGFYIYGNEGVVQFTTDGLGVVPQYGLVWAQQKRPETVIGKIGGTVASGGTGTVTVWSGSSFATLATTEQTIENVTNWGPDVVLDDWVNVSWPHERPYFVKRCT